MGGGARPDLARPFEGWSPQLESIIASAGPGAAAYKWNDRNLLISPLARDFGSFNFTAALSANTTNQQVVSFSQFMSRRGAVWVQAAQFQAFQDTSDLAVTLLSLAVFWQAINRNFNTVTLPVPATVPLSTIGVALGTGGFPLLIPITGIPLMVLSDNFNKGPVDTIGAAGDGLVSLRAILNVFVKNTDAAARTVTMQFDVWYRVIEGLEP